MQFLHIIKQQIYLFFQNFRFQVSELFEHKINKAMNVRRSHVSIFGVFCIIKLYFEYYIRIRCI